MILKPLEFFYMNETAPALPGNSQSTERASHSEIEQKTEIRQSNRSVVNIAELIRVNKIKVVEVYYKQVEDKSRKTDESAQ
jgi:hypothetical protein